MKAWLLNDTKGLDSLRIGDVPDPQPVAGEVVLDLQYAGLNPADRFLAEGAYPAKPPFPHILGRDGIGTVSAMGSGVTHFKIGQQLMILRGDTGVSRAGTFAQKVAVCVDCLVSPPDDWAAEQSAGASLVYLTAYQALTQWGELPPSVVLITGASGGVGVATLHLANAMDHTIIALSRHPEKRQKLLEMGAAQAIDPADAKWVGSLKDYLAPRRVDLVVDNIAGPLLPLVIETLGNRGKISLVGRAAGPVPQFNTGTLFFRRLRMGGVAVGANTAAEARAAWEAIVTLLKATVAKPLVDSIFKFDQLRPAFKHLAAGPMGKILLDIRGAGE